MGNFEKKAIDTSEEVARETRNASLSIEKPSSTTPFKRHERKCTDLFCLVLFSGFWIGMLVIAGIGYRHGKPQRLIYGTDWMGRTCGAHADKTDHVPAYDFTDYKLMIYPRLSEDLKTLAAAGYSTHQLARPSTLRKLFGVCVSSCPLLMEKELYIHAYLNYTTHGNPVNEDKESADGGTEYPITGSPWKLVTNTTNVLYRCVALTKIEVSESVRCIDECTDDEVKSYRNGTVTKLTCGMDEESNPFTNCGTESCTDVINALRPNCTSMETTKEERHIGTTTEDPVTEMLSRKWYMVARWLGDLQKAAFPVLICGGLFALILGFLWLILLRYCAGVFVWLVIVLVVVMQLVITVFCAYEGNLISGTSMQSTLSRMGMSSQGAQAVTAATTSYITAAGITAATNQAYYWAIACYVFIAIDLLLFVLLLFMYGRLRIAIGIIREASKALQSMPMLTLYPLVPTLFAVGLVAYWLVAAAFIATSSQIVPNNAPFINGTDGARFDGAVAVKIKESDTMHYLMIYHLFGLIWTSQFIQAAAYTTIAGAICEYYWTLDKRQIRARPVLRSMWRTVRYHFGSIAFGSLLIAFVQLFRLVLEYLNQKLRQVKQTNKVVKVVLMCLQTLFWCFEKWLQFLNKNAFIVIAMTGQSFCPAMKHSFSLLYANAARVATVSIVTRFLMLLGKVFITGFCVLFLFVCLRYPPPQIPSFFMGELASISSPIFPMILTGLLSYATASFFLDVYGMAIDTILLCFCEECNVIKPSDHFYMSDELVAYIEGPAKHNAFAMYKTRHILKPATLTAPPIVQVGRTSDK